MITFVVNDVPADNWVLLNAQTFANTMISKSKTGKCMRLELKRLTLKQLGKMVVCIPNIYKIKKSFWTKIIP